LFFLPLIAVQIPIVGELEVSGYDMLSASSGLTDQTGRAADMAASPEDEGRNSNSSPESDLPLSIQAVLLIPIAIAFGFLFAGVSIVSALLSSRITNVSCAIGAFCALYAVLHITVMNSDLHSLFAQSSGPTSLDADWLASGLGNIIAKAVQLKPGWGLYALFALLATSACFGFYRQGSAGR